MIMKKEKVIAAYQILKGADMKKVERFEEKRKVIGLLRKMRPVAEEYDSTMETAREKLKPDGYEESQSRLAQDGATQADLLKANILKEKYSVELGKVAKGMLAEEADIDCRMDDELLEKLCESNPEWKAEQILLLSDLTE